MNQKVVCLLFVLISAYTVIAQIGGTITASSNCANVRCGANEICNSCGQACEQRCGQGPIACSPLCLMVPRGVCQCAVGFYRNAQGACVLSSQCRRSNKKITLQS
ncbi:unnamed protein product, partial [Mesorhabditis belari]|uniref:TIL domain-containing protein n=1 Tax=Mesorhabditis belari TaxID=2138241 RepID=A0AAF3EYW7_9BILA